MENTVGRPQKWAILIGIDKYNHKDGRLRKRYTTKGKEMAAPKDLNGCVNDILAVREFLITTMKLDPANITMLLAPTERDTCHMPLPDVMYQEPTYENMVQALTEIPKNPKLKKDDLVYIHYSGHGGQATTIFSDLKGSDEIDHCLLPTDISLSKGKCLRDIEIGALLEEIVKAGVVLTVVLDCCHSGGAIRGDGDDDDDLEGVRGDERVYQSDFDMEEPVSRELIDRCGKIPQWMQEPRGFVVLTACLDHQKAKETIHHQDKYYHGRLTFSLLNAVRSCPLSYSSSTIYNRVRAKVQRAVENQTPFIIGDDDRFFFGPKYRTKVYALPVEAIIKKREIILGGGLYHGVKEEAEYAILPLSFDFGKTMEESDVLARVKVKHVRQFQSDTTLVDGPEAIPPPQLGKIKEGCPAVLQSLPLEVKAAVHFVGDEKRWVQFKEEWDKYMNSSRANSLLQLLPMNEKSARNSALLTVRVDSKDRYQLKDRPGSLTDAVAQTLDTLQRGTENSMPRLFGRLEHMARFHLLRELENPGLRSNDLATMVSVDVRPAPKRVEEKFSLRSVDNMQPRNGVYEVPDGRIFQVTVKNKTKFKVGCTILNFLPEFGIQTVFPPKDTSPYRTIGPRKKMVAHLGVKIPKNLRKAASNGMPVMDIFKIMVSRPETDVRSLRLAKLAEMDSFFSRGESSSETVNSLDDLLARLRPLFRDGFNVEGEEKVADWQTKDIVVRVLPSAGK